MFLLINQMILKFRGCFKRTATWRWFAVLVIGFMIQTSHRGITSTISTLHLNPKAYHKMMHFFRSTAYETDDIYEVWTTETVKDPSVLRISGRVVQNGDHIKISKEGRRMPGIQVHHQESENSGKGDYITGHIFAQIGVIMTNGVVSRNIPLVTERQESPPKIPGTKKPDGDTLVVQMGKLALGAATDIYEATGERSIGVYDAFFSKGTMFNTTQAGRTPDGQPILSVVTRAQDSYVGFIPGEPPDPDKKRGRGRPKKEGGNIYGEKVVLKSLLNNRADFTKVKMTLYGKQTDVEYLCLDLLWKSTDSLMRFVIVHSSRGQCILMTDDLSLTPEEIITIYCLRFKIESSFDEQKNEIGCFDYHFWTLSLEKRKRRKASKLPEDEAGTDKVKNVIKAIDAYVCLGTIATGIMTNIAFKHDCDIWQQYPGWIRTRRNLIPTLAVVKETLSHGFDAFLRENAHLSIAKSIIPHRRTNSFLYGDSDGMELDMVA